MLSFKSLNEHSRLIGLIMNDNDKVEETLYLNELLDYNLEQDSEFAKGIGKYAEEFEKNAKDLITSFKMKKEYKLEVTPPVFNDTYERNISYICGKSGSGKSYYMAKYIRKYHHMNPRNLIYYVSANRIGNDKSYLPLFEKKSFQKVFRQIRLSSINNIIPFEEYRNCIFIFDDILDVEVSLSPDEIANLYLEEKKSNNAQDVKLLLSDQVKIARITKIKSELIKHNIVNSIFALLNLGRKNGISVLVSDHKLHSGGNSCKIISESHNIVLFPHGNVSSSKLEEFLVKKLSFDKDQAAKVINKVFKKYEFLNINVAGDNFYLTSNEFKFL